METALDKFGRILIPKKMRRELGLNAGAVFEIEKADGAIRLQPVKVDAPVTDHDGVLVFCGTLAGELKDFVTGSRNERLRKAAGWTKP